MIVTMSKDNNLKTTFDDNDKDDNDDNDKAEINIISLIRLANVLFVFVCCIDVNIMYLHYVTSTFDAGLRTVQFL